MTISYNRIFLKLTSDYLHFILIVEERNNIFQKEISIQFRNRVERRRFTYLRKYEIADLKYQIFVSKRKYTLQTFIKTNKLLTFISKNYNNYTVDFYENLHLYKDD